MDNECPICGDIDGNYESSGVAQLFGNSILDEAILWSDANLFLLPAPGCIVPGYLILATRDHLLNFANLQTGVLRRVDSIWGSLRKESFHLGLGNYVLFEHGSGAYGRGSGCIEHAHLHMVPCKRPYDLLYKMQNSFEGIRIDQVSKISEVYSGQPYIVLSIEETTTFFQTPAVLSQQLRRIVAEQQGIGEQWNWREYPQQSNFLSTLRLFQELFREGALAL
jgi:hypothetical protein